MASTPTSGLRLELMATGENDSTWGTKTNVNLQLLENALTKRTALALSNVDVTLSTTNYADDQSRALCLALSGVLTGNVNVIVPSLSHFYLVENACTGSFTVTVKTAAGTGIVCTQAKTSILYCNTIDVIAPVSTGADADTLDGLDSTAFAQRAVFNQFVGGSGHTFHTLADGATITADCSTGDRFIVTLAGNRTLALSNPADGQSIEIWFAQDGTGGRTIAFPSNLRFPSGVIPSLSGIADGSDVIKLTYNSARDEWVCDSLLGLAGGVTLGLTFDKNETNVRLFERAGSPAGAATVNVIVKTGTLISSLSPTTAAFDTTGFGSGTVINLVNSGVIHGMGGAGGSGAMIGVDGSSDGSDASSGRPGKAGGTAILGPGTGRTLNITNASGRIWGGGGGGGGGGASSNGGNSNGGGGGGGAGGGLGGSGGTANGTFAVSPPVGADGGDAGLGLNGVGAAGGAGGSLGSAAGGAGGNGGTFGVAGAAGTANTTFVDKQPAGAAGAAGKAIDVNSATVVFLSGSGGPNVLGAVS